MKDYQVLESATIVADEIRLNKDQAARRKHLLKKGKGKDIYIPLDTLTFKAGEVIGLQDVSKTNMARLKCLEEEEPEKKDTAPEKDKEPEKDTEPEKEEEPEKIKGLVGKIKGKIK